MNKTLAITAIALVAVVMGMSAIAPMIQYAEAGHGGPDLSDNACVALQRLPNPPAAVVELIQDHCSPCPNPSHLGFVFEGEITSISDPGNLLGGIIAEGETWSTFYCLDANTPDLLPGNLMQGIYAIDFIAITIGDDDEFVCTDPAFPQFLVIGNQASFDSYQLFCSGMTPPVLPGIDFSLFNIFLSTTNTAVFADTSLPAFAPNLNKFKNQILVWNIEDFSSAGSQVTGSITSFVQVQ